jgi:tRNA(Ile)-lysidine synthase
MDVELPVPGSLSTLQPEWEFTTTLMETGTVADSRTNTEPFTAWMRLDAVTRPIRLRTRRSGDSFVPLGMEQEVRLSDFLSAQHLAAGLRESWPIVCDKMGIVWVPGYRICQRVALNQSGGPCLRIVARRLNPSP